MKLRATFQSFLVVCVAAASGLAQPRDASASAFLAAARRAAEKYRAPDAAIADGYRPVGVEFPAMGEHWVNLARVMADTIAADRPSVLIYVSIDGKQQLGGVGFTDLLRPGEALPSHPAAGFWHEHNGTVAEESFPIHHQMGQHGGGDKDALRLGILHVWTHATNPAGPFATDNWTLPSLRLARKSMTLDATATRGLALAQDATGYYELMLRTALRPSDAEEAIIEQTLDDASEAARSALRRPGSHDTGARLTAVWDELWKSLSKRLPRHRSALARLRKQL